MKSIIKLFFLFYSKMPRKANKVNVSEPEQVEAPQIEPQPLSATREEYLQARAVIQLYRENQKNRPKRKCSERQLEALAQGRAKNARNKKNTTPEQDHQ